MSITSRVSDVRPAHHDNSRKYLKYFKFVKVTDHFEVCRSSEHRQDLRGSVCEKDSVAVGGVRACVLVLVTH